MYLINFDFIGGEREGGRESEVTLMGASSLLKFRV